MLIIKNLESEIITYDKGRIISTHTNYEILIGIILNGSANIEMYDYNGNKTIIEKLENNSIFGNIFLYMKNDISVVATSKCEVMFFEYKNFLKNLKNPILINNVLNIYTNKIISLNIKIELLSKRTIKDKLLLYFRILSKKNHSKTFNIPCTYTELADYLSIDRSAMMREIKKLKDNGFIKVVNKKIKLIKN